MNRVSWTHLISGFVVLLGFHCSGMVNEVKVVPPSLSPLCEDFRTESGTFKQRAESAIERLKLISGDDAFFESQKLKSDLQTVQVLELLITEYKDGSTKKIKQGAKDAVLEICCYLTGIMPYAGEMQAVIASVLIIEFGVNSISELKEMTQ
jgi:hypothetical protein